MLPLVVARLAFFSAGERYLHKPSRELSDLLFPVGTAGVKKITGLEQNSHREASAPTSLSSAGRQRSNYESL